MTSTMGRRAYIPTEPPELRAERLALVIAAGDALDAGGRVPCIGRNEWTSEDLEEQQAAAYQCQGCAVLARCRAYAAAWPQHTAAGVYGGLTERDRRRTAREEAAS